MANEELPAYPKSILRGHKVQVHAAAFIRNNERLVTGDADGFVIVWDLTIMRARAVWQAHMNAILGIEGWGRDKLITHGRDNKLIIWKFSLGDESTLSTTLPLDAAVEARPQPWMLHLLEVNTMNFCGFAACELTSSDTPSDTKLLIAVPNTLASEAIDIFQLPSQHRIHTVRLGGENGMVMAVSLFYQGARLILVAGYENGLAIVAALDDDGSWLPRYKAQPHSQPILSLDVSADKTYFLTSSADAIVAKHPIPSTDASYSFVADTPKANAQNIPSPQPNGKSMSLLSAALAGEARPPAANPRMTPDLVTLPLKVVNTKHSGQQSLRIRSDGKVFATGGWDARVRVYSAKTMKEVAVLKWHQVGCYAVAFSEVGDQSSEATEQQVVPSSGSEVMTQYEAQGAPTTSLSLGSKTKDLSVKERRIRHVETAHWLAAGSKDGKLSLWDVF